MTLLLKKMFDLNIKNPEEWMIWFDLDDTLWDFRLNSYLTLQEVYDFFNLERFWKDSLIWRQVYHSVNDPLWEEYAKGLITQKTLRKRRFYDSFIIGGMSHKEADSIAEKADIFYLTNLGKKNSLIEGALTLLERLKNKRFKIGILSNGFSDIQQSKALSANIFHFFDVFITSDIYGINKPDVRLFRQAEKVAKVSAERCIMIGDNGETDIAGALKASWASAIWFNPGHKPPGKELCMSLSECCTLTIVNHLNQIQL